MAIRRSINPPKVRKTGFPDIEFRGYARRFGQTCAVFYSAGMQMLNGDYIKAPNRGNFIHHWNISAVHDEIDQRTKKNLPTALFEHVLMHWPDNLTAMELPSYTFPPYKG